MAQDRNKESSENKHSGDNFKSRVKKDKTLQSKVVIRHLPATMNEEQFLEQISPVPDHDYFHFVKGDLRLGQFAFSRAYLNFTQQDDIFIFKEKFDGYVFVDAKGNDYPAIVEFAPFQKIPKKRSKKRDVKCATIETDVDYLNFLESLKKPDENSLPTAEVYLEEIESREKELKASNGVPKITTPLIEYLRQRKIEQQKIREEKREERKRKEIEKKRLREEERRRRKAEKDRAKEKLSEVESQSEKEVVAESEEAVQGQDETKANDTVVQVLKNPEREKDAKEHMPPQKMKEFYVRSNKDRTRKEWVSDKYYDRTKSHHPKDRMRMSERGVFPQDKDHAYREKSDHKSYFSSKKGDEESSHRNKTSDEKHVSVTKESSHKEEKDSVEFVVDKNICKSKRDKSCPGSVETSSSANTIEQDEFVSSEKDTCSATENTCHISSEANEGAKDDNSYGDSKEHSKDPRADRRIRNKDRPSLEIYRPGMRRFSAQRNSPQKEISTSTSNSSTPSPSPTPPNAMIGAKVQVRDCDKAKMQKPAFSADKDS